MEHLGFLWFMKKLEKCCFWFRTYERQFIIPNHKSLNLNPGFIYKIHPQSYTSFPNKIPSASWNSSQSTFQLLQARSLKFYLPYNHANKIWNLHLRRSCVSLLTEGLFVLNIAPPDATLLSAIFDIFNLINKLRNINDIYKKLTEALLITF